MKNKMVQDLTEIIRNQDLANQAQWVERSLHTQSHTLVMTHVHDDANLLAADRSGPCPLLKANQQVATSTISQYLWKGMHRSTQKNLNISALALDGLLWKIKLEVSL